MQKGLSRANKNTLDRIRFDYSRHLPMTQRERLLMDEVTRLENQIGIGRETNEDEEEEELSED